jgi:hypothetical protein
MPFLAFLYPASSTTATASLEPVDSDPDTPTRSVKRRRAPCPNRRPSSDVLD